MNGWVLSVFLSSLVGVVVFLWQRHVAARERVRLDRLREEAERERSNAEVRLAAKAEEMDRLREDNAEALRRQAGQFAAQISDLNDKRGAAQAKTEAAQAEVRRLESDAKASRTAREAQEQRIADMKRHYEDLLGKMKDEFKSLSEDVLKAKTEQLEKSGVASMAKCADSLRQELESFRKRADKINEEDVARTAELKTGIRLLLDQTKGISEEADKLAAAIRSEAQVTGQWGEVQLMRVLELGGLTRTVDYDYQEAFASPESDRVDKRTDVLVKMPEDRWLVIDAKTTMAAYVDYVGENGERNAEALGRIVASLVEHVKEMKTVGYHKKLEATTGKRILNTMLMYIPFEEVYLVAMKTEVDGPNGKIPLREWAWRNDVVFVNASGLIPLVRMLAELWARDRSERKVLEIKEAAESLVEKFRTFLVGTGGKKDGFLSIGAGLMTAVGAFNESVKRLSDGRGSILKRLSDLKEAGVSTTDRLPPSEQVAARQVTVSPSVPVEERGE